MELIVTPTEISERFDALIRGAESRESIEDWARIRMKASEARALRYEPRSDESRLWDAIKYLLGVSLRTEPETYLHCTADFKAYREKHGF
jgi:hypothetical protein